MIDSHSCRIMSKHAIFFRIFRSGRQANALTVDRGRPDSLQECTYVHNTSALVSTRARGSTFAPLEKLWTQKALKYILQILVRIIREHFKIPVLKLQYFNQNHICDFLSNEKLETHRLDTLSL